MTEQVTPYQVIGNIATLDLRTTSEATFATIKSINNVATVIYSPETAPLMTHLALKNVATTLEVPHDHKVMAGQITVGPNHLQSGQPPLKWLLSGQIFFDTTLSAEQIERGFDSLFVSGQIFCPEHLVGILQSKIKHMSGQLIVIPSNAKIVVGKLALTESYVRELADGTNFVILGKLVASQPLPPDLLTSKVGQIHLYGKVICAEENNGLIRALQAQPVFGEIVIVPAGHELIERSLLVDAGLLETLSARKLYCTGLVHFDQDVTPEAVDHAIDKLVASRVLIAPTHIRKVLAQKCDLLNTTAIFYTGTLWLIDGEATLDHNRFSLLEGQVTLVVLGSLRVEAAIAPELLTSRLLRVHNLGAITANSVQLAALQSKAGVNEGEWADSSLEENAHDEDVPTIGNIAYLQL